MQLEEQGAIVTFTDNDQIGKWAKQAVAQAVQTEMINGYEDGSFRPNAHITRAEMAVMIARALKLPLKANSVTVFADDEAIPQWAKSSVEAIRAIVIASGREGNKFVPNETATRAEAGGHIASDVRKKRRVNRTLTDTTTETIVSMLYLFFCKEEDRRRKICNRCATVLWGHRREQE